MVIVCARCGAKPDASGKPRYDLDDIRRWVEVRVTIFGHAWETWYACPSCIAEAQHVRPTTVISRLIKEFVARHLKENIDG